MIEFIYNYCLFAVLITLTIIAYSINKQWFNKMNNYFKNSYLLILLLCIIATSSCNITKKIEANKLLVVENKVNVETETLSSDAESSLEYQLSKVAKQKPNKKFFGRRMRLRSYYRIQNNLAEKNYTDTTKIQKFILENYAESPIYYNRTEMESSTETMEYYLNNKGYFDAVVIADTISNLKKKTVQVVYTAKIGETLTIRKVEFASSDDTIKNYLPIVASQTFLKDSKALNKNLFSDEKSRISRQLQNLGFAYFYPNYIFFEGDSTQALLKTDVKVILKSPSDSTFHQRYRIGNTYIFTQYNPTLPRPTSGLDTLTVDGFEGFYLMKAKNVDKYWVKSKPILNTFVYKKGDLYSADKYEETRRNLAGISAYRFIRIKSSPNPDNPNLMDFFIYMNPSSKMEAGVDFELNHIASNRNDATVNNLGIFGNLRFKHNNIFRGSELLTISGTAGIELNLNDQNARFVNTLAVSLQADLKSPVIRSNNILNGAQSRITGGYNFISRELFFQDDYFSFLTTIFSLSAGYDRQNKRSKHSLNPISINLLLPNIDSAFIQSLNNRPLLARSYDEQLIIGSNYNYSYQTPTNTRGESYSFQLTAELAGNSLNLADFFINRDANFQFFNESISYSQFALIDLQGSYTKRFTEKRALAFRLNIGVGKAYGNADELPYVKQFFSGGNASIRAWQIRDIGPGGYKRPEILETVTPFQTGDIKLEFNAEYRFLASRYLGLDGAFFIDAGNIWLFEDNEKLEREFNFKTFYDQIAIGSGFGIRKDFSFFVFRLDLGFKIRTPYESELNRLGGHYFLKNIWTQPNYVIAIGYPF